MPQTRILLSIAAAILLIGGLTPFAQFAVTSAAELSTVAAQDGILAVAGAEGVSLYSAPNGTPSTTMVAGSVLTAIGRSGDNQWVMVTTEDGETAWAQVSQLVLFGLERLPEVADGASDGDAPDGDTAGGGSTAPAAPTSVPAEEPTATVTAPPTAPATATTPPTATATRPPPTATNTSSPSTSSPSPSPLPALTRTPRPTSTPVPTRTPTLASNGPSDLIVVVGGSGATMLDAPSSGAVVKSLGIGFSLTALGRADGSDWLFVDDGEDTGWVSTGDVIAFRIDTLPFMADTMIDASDTASDASSAATATSVTTTSSATTSTADSDASSAGGTIPAASAAPAAPAQQTGISATVQTAGARLNVRAGPGTNFGIVAKALNSQSYPALARTADGAWIQLEVVDAPDRAGWVSASFVALNAAIDGLPVAAQSSGQPAPPIAAPTSAPAPTTRPAPTTAPTTAPPAEPPTSSDAQSAAPQVSTQAVAATQPLSSAAPASGLLGKLAFQATGGQIYVYDLPTGNIWQLTNGRDPEISPNGSQVAFTRAGGASGVYVINIDGSGEYKVAVGGEDVRSPKWSPDGGYILFSRIIGEYRCFDPGIGICFDGPVSNTNKAERGLSRVDLVGDNFRDIAALNTARAPDWTTAGIVYHAVTGLEKTEDKSDATTEAIINEQVGYQDPDWQPSGGKIIYQVKQGSHWEIFSINPNGSSEVALTRPVTTLVDELPSNVAPVWSPDGQHIAFLSNREADNSAGPWRIWVMNADGSNQRQLPIQIPIEFGFNWEQIISWGR